MYTEGPCAACFCCLRFCFENPGPTSIPQTYGAAVNSNDSWTIGEVKSKNVLAAVVMSLVVAKSAKIIT